MPYHRFQIWKFILVLGLTGCGGSTTIKIDIDVAANQSANPMVQIAADESAGTSRGLYIAFEPLNCPPQSMEDLNGSLQTVIQPDTTGPGLGVANSYKINTSLLASNTYYRVRLFSLNVNSSIPPYQGVSDCPINVSLGNQSQSTICFGVNDIANPPVCPGTIPYAQCPAVSAQFCQ